jgi:hypothetical protein
MVHGIAAILVEGIRIGIVKCESKNRVLGKSGGRLAFVRGSGVIEHNRGYIDVSSNADDAIIESTDGISSIE